MIEMIMYFALGFLLAMALALTAMPAVWTRAVRLTRRRIESLVPVSLAEIQADKDQLRAEYAVAIRRVEIEAEALRQKTAEQLAEIGRKTETILALRADLADRDAGLEALGSQDRALADHLAAVQQELAARTQTLEQVSALLSDREASLAGLQRLVDETASLSHDQKAEIATLTAQAASLRQRLAAREQELEQFIDERGRAARMAVRLADLENRLASYVRERDMLLKRIAVLEGEIERGPAALTAAMATLKADNGALEGTLAQAREEIARLRHDLAEARRQAEGTGAAERSENALLRERISDVAAEIARLTAQIEGPSSPIPALIAEPARLNGAAPAPDAPAAPASLAERIRTLQARTANP
ncbi:hypothetical protein [Blastochloris sulfoviridis]|uniref:Uncharacterized protein n=1 Tax=Blastochloris sulfoviridis TaxID=50712 RepID=A0A5M6I231_9HYPH|nr:hypothetical protein [Blastochloris sulfoviridis]KAA5602271.1 hypothetical protein F1193_06515 [Blastochloris sulfoviridis]